MSVSVYLPLVFTAAFGLVVPMLARRLPPAIGTWLLSGGGVLAATGSSASLALLAFSIVARAPFVAHRAHWSDAALSHSSPVSVPIGVVAAAAVVVLAVRFVRAARGCLRSVHDAYLLADALPDTGSELSVLQSKDPYAFAVPGRPGRIVVTTGLLRTLDAAERRALLAHEQAHLQHRHYLHQCVARLSSAVNPLLYRLPAAIELSSERWADEDAAGVCRREVVADALTRAATGSRRVGSAVMLAAAASDVADRIRALRATAPRLALWRVAVPLCLLVATALAVLEAMHDTERIFELAQLAYRAGQR